MLSGDQLLQHPQVISADPSGQVHAVENNSAMDDIRAQKRLAIGLSARRPTATSYVQRPPGSDIEARFGWLLVTLLIGVVLVTMLLLIAKLDGSLTHISQLWQALLAW